MSRVSTPRDLIPEPHCVFGTMLRPFSLGHHLLLLRTNSPFCGDPEASNTSPEALMLSVFLCADSFSSVQSSLVRGEWEPVYAKWQRAIAPKLFRRSRFDVEAEQAKFAAYLQDGYKTAPVWRSGGPSFKLSAPWECLLSATLIKNGFSYQEAMDLYLPSAWYFFHTFCEFRQLEVVKDMSQWRRTFYTEEDDARMHPKPAAQNGTIC